MRTVNTAFQLVKQLLLARFELPLLRPAELVMAQTVAREGRIHNHQVGGFGLGDLRLCLNLLDAGGPGQQARLPVFARVQKFQRAQFGFIILVHTQQGAVNLHTLEGGRGRQQTQRGRGQMRRRQVDVEAGQDLLDEQAGNFRLIAGCAGQIADALGGRHQERTGAAGGVGDAQLGDGGAVRPVEQVRAECQVGQQGRGRGGGVERAIVAGGV